MSLTPSSRDVLLNVELRSEIADKPSFDEVELLPRDERVPQFSFVSFAQPRPQLLVLFAIDAVSMPRPVPQVRTFSDVLP
jgi:hypothetical protein